MMIMFLPAMVNAFDSRSAINTMARVDEAIKAVTLKFSGNSSEPWASSIRYIEARGESTYPWYDVLSITDFDVDGDGFDRVYAGLVDAVVSRASGLASAELSNMSGPFSSLTNVKDICIRLAEFRQVKSWTFDPEGIPADFFGLSDQVAVLLHKFQFSTLVAIGEKYCGIEPVWYSPIFETIVTSLVNVKVDSQCLAEFMRSLSDAIETGGSPRILMDDCMPEQSPPVALFVRNPQLRLEPKLVSWFDPDRFGFLIEAEPLPSFNFYPPEAPAAFEDIYECRPGYVSKNGFAYTPAPAGFWSGADCKRYECPFYEPEPAPHDPRFLKRGMTSMKDCLDNYECLRES